MFHIDMTHIEKKPAGDGLPVIAQPCSGHAGSYHICADCNFLESYFPRHYRSDPQPICGKDEGDQNGSDDENPDIGIATKTRAKSKKPNLYKVLLLNDDYTPMTFVVIILKRFFSMDVDEATRVMLHVHQRGVGICGVFSYEIAETKVNQVMDFARQNQHPLQCTLEKA